MSPAKKSETLSVASSRVAKKAYPGASLRHLGSVRDVTLAKTKSVHEGVGSKHT